MTKSTFLKGTRQDWEELYRFQFNGELHLLEAAESQSLDNDAHEVLNPQQRLFQYCDGLIKTGKTTGRPRDMRCTLDDLILFYTVQRKRKEGKLSLKAITRHLSCKGRFRGRTANTLYNQFLALRKGGIDRAVLEVYLIKSAGKPVIEEPQQSGRATIGAT